MNRLGFLVLWNGTTFTQVSQTGSPGYGVEL